MSKNDYAMLKVMNKTDHTAVSISVPHVTPRPLVWYTSRPLGHRGIQNVYQMLHGAVIISDNPWRLGTFHQKLIGVKIV